MCFKVNNWHMQQTIFSHAYYGKFIFEYFKVNAINLI